MRRDGHLMAVAALVLGQVTGPDAVVYAQAIVILARMNRFIPLAALSCFASIALLAGCPSDIVDQTGEGEGDAAAEGEGDGGEGEGEGDAGEGEGEGEGEG